MIANRLQIEAAILMVILRAHNAAREAPYDSALMIRFHSNVSPEESKYLSPPSVIFFPALMTLDDYFFAAQQVTIFFRANMLYCN